jgi:hypothetical protein
MSWVRFPSPAPNFARDTIVCRISRDLTFLAFSVAFVILVHSTLCESAQEIRARWKGAYGAYFPTTQDRRNAIFVKLDVERMELWIRGVTPEPYGLRPTVLERDVGRGWRLA